MSTHLDTLFISTEETCLRMDLLLAKRFTKYSRMYFQYLIEEGCVLLNGKVIKKRTKPEIGDEIEVFFRQTPEPSLAAEKIDLNILYEDEHLLAVNKPSGMVTHPAPGNWSGTFVNALLGYCAELAPGSNPLRPGIVHRLDKETTGVILAAKTREAHQKLIEGFSSRMVEKTYLAICVGKPPDGVIKTKIGRHPIKRKEMAVLEERGKEAITSVKVLAYNERLSLVQAMPKTGRTHQIRVHLKHIGCPILGDPVYGNTKAERLFLHAHRLELTHPITKEPLSIMAPIPEDMARLISKLE